MCRIAGIINKSLSGDELLRQVKAMADVQRHGGPDDEGFFVEESRGMALGHRRLALLDLSHAGHQPMFIAGSRYGIIFNGEIYNFRELKEELEHYGHSFKSSSDTEVILYAFLQWGCDSFMKFKGMFAFALTDQVFGKTYLVRDAGGIKPLYYSVRGENLYFASEVKAFQQAGTRFEENGEWKIYFLAFGHIPEPYTTLKDVQHLPKGSFLEWDHRSSSFKIITFKKYSFTESLSNEEESLSLIREYLHQAVKRHLISDAPIGVFLSGGIDSSIITLLAHQYQAEQLRTLSINLQETDFAERKYQQLIVKQIGGVHNEYQVTYKDFVHHFDTIIASMDQPSNDGINSWFVCRSAKENGLKAVLSGLGGDELFGGYPSFNRINYLKKAKTLPSAFLKLADKHIDSRFKRFYYLSYQHPIGEYLFLRGFFTPGLISGLLDISIAEIDAVLQKVPIDKEIAGLSAGNRASWFEINLYMQNQLLRDTDYMSMSHGLEVRVPFLDQDLMGLMHSIAAQTKFSKKQPKHLLIKAFRNLLPEPAWNRKKMGFSFPFAEWMRRFEPTSNSQMYSNHTARNLVNDFKQGKLHWSHAFALYHVSK
jgi:asparagine synthase (glutamine-hydrolysing)